MSPADPASRRLPGAIWALGFVSLLMDVSSEMIHSLLPVFMVATLGVSMVTVGLIEGAAEATALIVKVFSGTLSEQGLFPLFLPDALQLERKAMQTAPLVVAFLTKAPVLASSRAWIGAVCMAFALAKTV